MRETCARSTSRPSATAEGVMVPSLASIMNAFIAPTDRAGLRAAA